MARQGFSFLVCPDPELLKDRIAELISSSEFTAKIFWGDEDLTKEYWQALAVPRMMAPPNAVVLRRAQEQNVEFWSKISATLATARTAIWPIFCLEGEWKTGRPALPKHIATSKFWNVAQAQTWIWQHPGLTTSTVGQEVDRFMTTHGRKLAPGVKQQLCMALPLSTIGLRNELHKILLLAGDETVITPAHLTALIKEDPFDIFGFLRDLQNPKTRCVVWGRLFQDPALANGDLVFSTIALLVREARILWHLAQNEDGKVNLPPRVKADKKHMATRLGPGPIGRIWDLALKTDTDIKTGRARPDQAMENLIRGVQDLW